MPGGYGDLDVILAGFAALLLFAFGGEAEQQGQPAPSGPQAPRSQ